MTVFQLEGYAHLVVLLAMLSIKGFALLSAVSFPAQAYPAAGRGTKIGWAIGLGVGFAAELVLMGSSPLNLISLVFVIAALVFIVDTRPALADVTSQH